MSPMIAPNMMYSSLCRGSLLLIEQFAQLTRRILTFFHFLHHIKALLDLNSESPIKESRAYECGLIHFIFDLTALTSTFLKHS